MTAVLDGRSHEALDVLRMPLAGHRPDDGGREGVADGDRWTGSQGPPMQNCPVLKTKALMIAPTAFPKSASSKTMCGALPPNSMATA
jgi:hypothetical protein